MRNVTCLWLVSVWAVATCITSSECGITLAWWYQRDFCAIWTDPPAKSKNSHRSSWDSVGNCWDPLWVNICNLRPSWTTCPCLPTPHSYQRWGARPDGNQNFNDKSHKSFQQISVLRFLHVFIQLSPAIFHPCCASFLPANTQLLLFLHFTVKIDKKMFRNWRWMVNILGKS